MQSLCPPALLDQYLALLGGDCGVPVDEFGEDSTQGLDTQRQRCHIQQQHVSDVTGQNTALDGRSYGNSLIGVDRPAGSATEQVLDCLLNLQRQTLSVRRVES